MGKIKTTNSNNTKFFWRNDQEQSEYDIYRVIGDSGLKRSLDDICPQETANAIKFIVNSQISLLREDLTREVAKTFGFIKVMRLLKNQLRKISN